ncbi:hypothetical protein Cgig2_030037 [Carnegiea gigantea]|uniref:Uncharacterized protein n=1 Tax=Carnegiea gigantea TaxID=171969 RepID=A0A9Q1QAT1_9CARY|nr:hypothetical protein Cgig2_030037 [Carnegiea gigantea]
MRVNCCHRFLAFNLKFVNFLQLFLGISTIIYSAYLLNRWQNRAPIVPSPPPPAPVPALPPDYFLSLHSNPGSPEVGAQIDPLTLAGKLPSGSDADLMFELYSVHLPAPCLVILLLEVALVAFTAIDKQWEKVLPSDPTGELEKLKSFLQENADICKWVGITLLVVQALSVLLSLVLRAMISSTQRVDSDVENNYAADGDGIREPLNSQQNQPSGLTKGEGRATLSDIWTTRIRQKNGCYLNLLAMILEDSLFALTDRGLQAYISCLSGMSDSSIATSKIDQIQIFLL